MEVDSSLLAEIASVRKRPTGGRLTISRDGGVHPVPPATPPELIPSLSTIPIPPQFPPSSGEHTHAAYTDFLFGLELINQQEYVDPAFAPHAYHPERDRDAVVPRMLADWGLQCDQQALTSLSCFQLATKERSARQAFNERLGPSHPPPPSTPDSSSSPPPSHHASLPRPLPPPAPFRSTFTRQ